MRETDNSGGDSLPEAGLERRQFLAYTPPTLVAVSSLAVLTPPVGGAVTICGVTSSPINGTAKHTDAVTVLGFNFDAMVDNNLVTINNAHQVDLNSATDATNLGGNAGQNSGVSSGPVKVQKGRGGPVAGNSYTSSGIQMSTSFNVDGFAMNPAGGNQAEGCGTQACDAFNLTPKTNNTEGNSSFNAPVALNIAPLGTWTSAETGTIRIHLEGPDTGGNNAVTHTRYKFSPSAGITLSDTEAAEHIAAHAQAAFNLTQTQFAAFFGLTIGVTVSSSGTTITADIGNGANIAWMQVSKA
jgi:hypothetical protein